MSNPTVICSVYKYIMPRCCVVYFTLHPLLTCIVRAGISPRTHTHTPARTTDALTVREQSRVRRNTYPWYGPQFIVQHIPMHTHTHIPIAHTPEQSFLFLFFLATCFPFCQWNSWAKSVCDYVDKWLVLFYVTFCQYFHKLCIKCSVVVSRSWIKLDVVLHVCLRGKQIKQIKMEWEWMKPIDDIGSDDGDVENDKIFHLAKFNSNSPPPPPRQQNNDNKND